MGGAVFSVSGETTWVQAALHTRSVLFAVLSVILDKAGITGVESNLGTAIRTGEALVMAWVMVAVAGKLGEVRTVSPALPWLPGPLTVPLGSATTGSSSTALSA